MTPSALDMVVPAVETPGVPPRDRLVSVFDEDTAVAPIGDGVFEATVSHRWDVIAPGPPNGGYVLAIGGRAMREVAAHPHVTTITAHYVRPVEHGALTIHTEIVKTGRQFSTVAATMRQDDREVARLLGAFSDLDAFTGPTLVTRPALELPPLEDCLGPGDIPGGFTPPPIAQRLDVHLPRSDAGWTIGEPTGKPAIRGWARFADQRRMDDLGLLVLADAFPPAIFNADVPPGWVPTVELTVHVRRPGPIAGHLRCGFETRWLTNGVMEEDGVIEDADGNPVALSRQLALAPRA